MKVKKRFRKIAWIFFKIVLDFRKEYKLLVKKGYKYAQKKMEPIHRKRAQQLYELAISLGGVLIKLCQYLSTRRDIFPDAYIEILSPLQDNVPPVPFSDIERVLTADYGDYKRYFERIEEEPLASASLGQTHKAWLKDGREVVLKVLKPHIEEVIDIDFAILFYVFKLFSNFKIFRQRADFFKVLDEFVRVTGDELNFEREIMISRRFHHELEKFDYVSVPAVYDEYSSRHIIVMEYMHGDKISEIDKWRGRNNDPKELARRIVEIYVEQFLFIRLIHFDPHPGNILVTSDNNFVLLDYGMSGEITDKISRGIKDGLKAFMTKDYKKIINILDDLGFIRKGSNKRALLSIMEYFFDEVIYTVELEKESLQSVDLSPVIDDLVELIYSQPFNLPVEWAFVGRTVGTLVGIIANLNPKFKIYDELNPYAERLLRANFNDILENGVDIVKNNAEIALGLPRKLNTIIDDLERESLKVNVDFEELDDKIDEIKNLVVKVLGAGISFFAGFGAYMLYSFDHVDKAIPLAVFTGISLIFTITYKKYSRKDMIKKSITLK